MSDGKLALGAGYEIIKQTGRTEFGPVYKARDTERDETVAIRVRRDAPATEEAGRRLADRLAAVPHDAILPYRDCLVGHEEAGDVLCMVTDWIEGETLRMTMCRTGAGLSWVDAEPILTVTLDALIHACGCGLVHTAVSPAHVIVTTDGRTLVTGFGMLGWRDEAPERPAVPAAALDYAAPEFLTTPGFEGDPVSEIFSFAVCVHEALTCELPFLPACGGSAETFAKRWGAEKPEPAPLKRSVLRVLINARKFLKRALSPTREQRFQSLQEAAEAFREVRCRVIQHEDVDDYELLNLIGRGGYGAVYEARRQSDRRSVAFKYLALTAGVDRFKREAKILHRNPHPNIVEYVDFFATKSPTGDDQYFLVMELLPGMPGWTLSRRIREAAEGLDVGEIVRVFSGYLNGLQYLHDQRIIHRDIKPGNLYAPCDDKHRPKLIDLGIARDLSGTQTVGLIPGTWDYMAPELFAEDADRGTPQSDLYALALCLYEAAVGRPAMPRLPKSDREAASELMRRLKRNDPIDYSLPVFERSPWLADIVRRALLREPDKRFASATEMREALEEALLVVAADTQEEEDEPDTFPYAATDVLSATLDQEQAVRPPSPEPEAADASRQEPPDLAEPPKSGLWLTAAAAVLLLTAAATGVWYFMFGPGRIPALTIERPPSVSKEPKVDDTTSQQPEKPEKPDKPETTDGQPSNEPPVVVDAPRAELDALIARVSEPLPSGLPTADTVAQLSRLLARARTALDEHPNEEALAKACARIEEYGRNIPRRYSDAFNQAMDRKEQDKARDLLARWRTVLPHGAFLGLDRERAAESRAAMEGRLAATGAFDKAVSTLEAKLPRADDLRLADIPTLNREFAALKGLCTREWEGVTAADRDARAKGIEERLAVLVTNVLTVLRDSGTNTYLNGHDDSLLQQDIKAVTGADSAFRALAPAKSDAVVAELTAMRESREAFFVELTQLNRAVTALAAVKEEPARFEQVASRINAAEGRNRVGMLSEEKAAKLEAVRASLRKPAAAELAAIRDAADARGRKGQPVASLRGRLDDYRAKAPTVVAMLSDELEAAEKSVALWENRHRFGSAIKAFRSRVGALSAGDVGATDLQAVATELAGLRRAPHADVPPADVRTALDMLTAELKKAAESHVAKLGAAVATAYESGEDAEPIRRQLVALRQQAPDAVALAPQVYSEALLRAKPPEDLWVKQVVRALEDGKTAVDKPLRGADVNTEAVNHYLASAEGVRRGMDVTNMFVSDREALKFQAAVSAFWNAAAALSDKHAEQLDAATWRVIREQLVKQAQKTVEPKMMAMSPRRQTEIRRAFLGMACRIEALTRQISKCAEDDPLRLALQKYLQAPYYAPAIFDQGVIERVGMARIEWLIEMLKAKQGEEKEQDKSLD